jgi:hypothetical protein
LEEEIIETEVTTPKKAILVSSPGEIKVKISGSHGHEYEV